MLRRDLPCLNCGNVCTKPTGQPRIFLQENGDVEIAGRDAEGRHSTRTEANEPWQAIAQ